MDAPTPPLMAKIEEIEGLFDMGHSPNFRSSPHCDLCVCCGGPLASSAGSASSGQTFQANAHGSYFERAVAIALGNGATGTVCNSCAARAAADGKTCGCCRQIKLKVSRRRGMDIETCNACAQLLDYHLQKLDQLNAARADGSAKITLRKYVNTKTHKEKWQSNKKSNKGNTLNKLQCLVDHGAGGLSGTIRNSREVTSFGSSSFGSMELNCVEDALVSLADSMETSLQIDPLVHPVAAATSSSSTSTSTTTTTATGMGAAAASGSDAPFGLFTEFLDRGSFKERVLIHGRVYERKVIQQFIEKCSVSLDIEGLVNFYIPERDTGKDSTVAIILTGSKQELREAEKVLESVARPLGCSVTFCKPTPSGPPSGGKDTPFPMLNGFDSSTAAVASALNVDADIAGILSSASSPKNDMRSAILRFTGAVFESHTPEAFLAQFKGEARIKGLQISLPPMESTIDFQLSGTRTDLRQAQHVAAELCSSAGVSIKWMDDVSDFPNVDAFSFDAMNGMYIPFPGVPEHLEVKWFDMVLTGSLEAMLGAGIISKTAMTVVRSSELGYELSPDSFVIGLDRCRFVVSIFGSKEAVSACRKELTELAFSADIDIETNSTMVSKAWNHAQTMQGLML